MSFVTVMTIAGAVLGVASLGWVAYLLFIIGFDSHAVGPWTRPAPAERHTRLPADFIGLWSLFGRPVLRHDVGSWQAAVRRLDRLEASFNNLGGEEDENWTPPRRADGRAAAPSEVSEEWLDERLNRLEVLAGLKEPRPLQRIEDAST